jgi:hypothetical protein
VAQGGERIYERFEEEVTIWELAGWQMAMGKSNWANERDGNLKI